jgi:hypothetical protein
VWIAGLAIAAFTSAGCLSLAGITSGHIGCARDEITISDETSGGRSRTWTAECNGRRYFCSGDRQVACTEDGARAPELARAAAPSSSDRDDTAVCEAAYAHVADFATYWATHSDGSKSLDEAPARRDFLAVCRAMPENVQRCMHSGYLAVHGKACEAVLLRLEPTARSKVDGLFLEAERQKL